MYPVIHITDTISIPSYLIILSFIYSAGIIYASKRAVKLDMDQFYTLDISLCIMLGGFFGARIFHVLYEQPEYYWNDPIQLFKVWQGGFVYYGGAIGAFITAVIFMRIKKLNFAVWTDFFTPLFPLGYGFGRMACFLNGCCYGKACALPWGVHFKNVDPNQVIHRHPTQIYVLIWELLIFAAVLYFEKHRKTGTSKLTQWLKPSGQLFLFWLTFHALGRIFMEFLRDDFRGTFIFSLSVSTWISIFILMTASHFLFHRGRKAVFPPK